MMSGLLTGSGPEKNFIDAQGRRRKGVKILSLFEAGIHAIECTLIFRVEPHCRRALGR
jgi:hypothetical protein